MHSRSENTKFIFYNDVNEVLDELFHSLCSRYQGYLGIRSIWAIWRFDNIENKK